MAVVVRAVIVRPWLWPVAVVSVLRLAPPGWWRRWPPLPLPDPALWRFRLVTAYGSVEAQPDAEGVVSFLRWSRDMRQWRRR
jgi:hypothetical protein